MKKYDVYKYDINISIPKITSNTNLRTYSGEVTGLLLTSENTLTKKKNPRQFFWSKKVKINFFGPEEVPWILLFVIVVSNPTKELLLGLLHKVLNHQAELQDVSCDLVKTLY